MIFHVLVVGEGSAQAGSMFPAGGTNPPLDPLQPLAPAPPPPGLPTPAPSPTGASTAQEFRRVCTRTNLATCAPVCDETTYGYLLSIEIDGRGTVMTCNKVDGTFSWQGQASFGGYIGADSASFFSSVVSGAAGTDYMATIMQDAMITTDLSVECGQILSISGGTTVAAWGSGGFTLSDRASLSLTDMTVGGRVIVAAGAALTLDSVVMQPGACVAAGGQQVTLVNTATPEQCLMNVVFDDADPAAFLTNLASGLSGTYVLRVTNDPYTISSLNVGPQQDVRLISLREAARQ